MTPSQKLRSIADSTGLDGIANAIREVADEIEHNNAPAVPQGMRLVPVWLLKNVEQSLGSFVSDLGWAQADMDTMDSVSALLAATPAAPSQPVTLTDDEIRRNWSGGACPPWGIKFARAIIAALREKQGGV